MHRYGPPIQSASFVAFFLLSGMLHANASFPIVERSKPLGVVRGVETTIVLMGQRLGDSYAAISDQPGLEIVEVKALNGKRASVKLKTNQNLSPGLYPIRLVTRTGVSNIKLIGVGAMPITNETEPNNNFDSPQKVQWDNSKQKYGVTIEGVADREDVDFYQFNLKEGQRLTAEIEGIRLAYSLNNQNILDPYIAIQDEDQFEVASSDDSSLLGQDGVCSFVAPKDGHYTVLVRDSSFVGGPICGYRLHVGSFPRPIATIPGGGVPAAKLSSKLISIDGSTSEASVDLPTELSVDALTHLRPTDRWGVTTENETGISPSPNWIRVNELKVISEVEPNNDFRKPQIAEAPAALTGAIDKPGDFDCFAIEAKKGEKYRARCYARKPLRSPLDAVMNVYGPDLKVISSADDIATLQDPSIEFSCPVDGRYTVRIYDHLRDGSPLHRYRIELVKSVQTFSVALKETRRDSATVAAVPIGGRTAVMAQVTREGFNGEIELAVDGVPEDVSAECFPIPPGRTEIPIVFSASKEAEYSSGLFRVIGKGAASDKHTKNSSVSGLRMSQLHKLVLGQNRRSMFGYWTDKAAIAITKASPFKIELIQPKTPIVRRGSKNLKVRLVRDEAFVEQVSLRSLYNPPGIAVNNSQKINGKKDEAEIPMTANGGAAIGKWPIILIATYKDKNGNVEVSSEAIMLDVQGKYFDFAFPRVAAELGSRATVSVGLTVKRELPGSVEVELRGLPAGVTSPSPKQTITAETKTINFPIVVSKDAKPGKHKTLVCIARATVGDEVVVQTEGTGELRIDKPLPPKKKTSSGNGQSKKPEAINDSSKKNTKSEPKKPLTRLQQLRQAGDQQ